MLYISAIILCENLKSFRLFGFRAGTPARVPTNTKSEHTNRYYFCFLILILLGSIVSTGQKNGDNYGSYLESTKIIRL